MAEMDTELWEYTPEPGDGRNRWTYTGRDGTDMAGVIMTVTTDGRGMGEPGPLGTSVEKRGPQ